MLKAEYKKLAKSAYDAKRHSYSPYSHFRVGAALLSASGHIYLGTNVENASLGLSLCAERAAVVQAVTAGERRFSAIAICADGMKLTAPCGACRQVLLEFGPEMDVILVGEGGPDGDSAVFTVASLLPHAFSDYTRQAREDKP